MRRVCLFSSSVLIAVLLLSVLLVLPTAGMMPSTGMTPSTGMAPSSGMVADPAAGQSVAARAQTAQPATAPDAGLIRLRAGAFDPLVTPRGPASRGPALPARASQPDRPALYLVQFTGPIQPAWRAALDTAELQVVTFIPEDTYLVWGPHTAIDKLSAAAPVRWSGLYQSQYALHPALAPLATATGQTTETEVLVQVYDHPGAGQAVEQILKRAGAVFGPPQKVLAYQNLGVRLRNSDLGWLAALPEVVDIEPRPIYHKLDEVQGQIMAGNLNAAGTGPSAPGYLAWLQGLGFSSDPADYPIVDVTDDGIDDGSATPIHPDFYVQGDKTKASRLAYNYNWSSDPAADGLGGHGNINASIVAAYNDLSGSPHKDSNGYSLDLGINPFGRVAGSKVFANVGGWSLPGDNYTALISQTYALGGRISSNSWGGTTSGAYGIDDQAYDALVRDAQPGSGPAAGNQPMIVVFAAGNDGPAASTNNSPGNAKNVITVGASESYRPTWTDGCGMTPADADNSQDIARFSSRGPTTDGRVKPDLVAPGTHIQGAASQDPGYNGSSVCDTYHPSGQTLYAASSGTSHSTPAVAGAASLLYRYYQAHFGGAAPSPAMTKAYLIATTRYLNASTSGGTLPTNQQGYGQVNLGMAFDGASSVLIDQSHVFQASGQSYSLSGSIADPTRPLRITLAWTDAPGPTVGAAYVNDLDLEVDAGGKTYLGNVFSGSTSVTGGSADRRNNVEGVFLPAGTGGSYTVRVIAHNIAGDGVPGNSNPLDQDFALVVYNGTQAQAHLQGTTYDAGTNQPLPDVSLRATSSAGLPYSTVSDATGYYTLTVAPGQYTLEAWRYGYGLQSAGTVSPLSGTTTTRDFHLGATAPYALTGCLTDQATHAPLAGGVSVIGPFGDPITQTTVPQNTGCYGLTLPGSPYTITASARLHNSSSAALSLAGPTQQDFALTATTTDGLVWGYVTDQFTGAVVNGATVSGGAGQPSTLTGADGYYELQLAPGPRTLTASMNLYSPATATIAVPQSNLIRQDFALASAHLTLAPPGGQAVTLAPGKQVTHTLTITNDGISDLQYQIIEYDLGQAAAQSAARLSAAAGPADAFGYLISDNTTATGPRFDWIDATGGVALNLPDDGEANVTLPFPFKLYGLSSQSVRIGNNGGLLFAATTGDLSPFNAALNDPSIGNGLIVPFWDDLGDQTGNVYVATVGSAPHRRFVVEWYQRPHWSTSGGVGQATVELVLYEGTNNIKFQYQDTDFGSNLYDSGVSATVGIHQAGGTGYLQYSYNQPAVPSGRAICIKYPGSPTCDPTDIPWLTTNPAAGTIPGHSQASVALTFTASSQPTATTYLGLLRIYNNAPDAQPYVDYPVSLTYTNSGYALALTPRTAQGLAAPGSSITYTFRLTNTGTLADRYTVTAGSHRWPIALDTGPGWPVMIPPSASVPLTLTVTVPVGPSALRPDVMDLTITSQNDPLQPAASARSTVTSAAVLVHSYLPLLSRP